MFRKLIALPLVAAIGFGAIGAVASSGSAKAAPAAKSASVAKSTPTIAGIVASSGTGFDNNGRDFDVLLKAVQTAGLVDALNDPESNLTVFAPNDRAFVRTARSLGYTEWSESGAWAFLAEALTDLGDGDPIPVLTDILKYHVAAKRLSAGKVIFSPKVDTLLGSSFKVRFIELVDKDPERHNPYLDVTGLNIKASNGYVHVITRVLLPVDL